MKLIIIKKHLNGKHSTLICSGGGHPREAVRQPEDAAEEREGHKRGGPLPAFAGGVQETHHTLPSPGTRQN